MTQRIPEMFSTLECDLLPIMRNVLPPRDPNEDDDEDEDSDTEPEDEREQRTRRSRLTSARDRSPAAGPRSRGPVTCHRRAWVGAVRPVVVVPLALEWRAQAFAGAKIPGLQPPTV